MKITYDTAQLRQEHLDAMIKLAFDLEDIEAADQLLSTDDPALTAEEARLAEEAYLLACARVDKQNKPHPLLTAARKVLPWAVHIAACIILLLAIAAPVALANSATFRAKVMQLIMELDEEKGEAHFSFVADENAAFDVPEGWRGNYFPSYIPDGFTIYDYDPTFPMPFIEYRNEAADQLFYSEYSDSAGVVTGTDNAETKVIDINGNLAYLIDGTASDGKTHTVNIFWQNDTKWFGVVAYDLSTDEALQVARSVKRIVK